MSVKLKYAIGTSVFWNPADRVVSTGYKTPITEKQVYALIKKVKGIQGLEIWYPYDFKEVKKIKRLLNNTGIGICSVGAGIFSESKWQYGSVTSLDKNIRKEAIDICKRGIYASAELESKNFTFWPAHDGYDYYFQTDYQIRWELLLNALRELAMENEEVNIGIEYKAKEPRTHQIISSAAKALSISEETEMKNVGVIMDVGHSFICHENPAEEAVYLMNKKRLFHLHNNDNYADWDYDMIPGSVHLWENIELFYWLSKMGYEGWINFDICPFREDAVDASNISIDNVKKIVRFIEKIDESLFEDLRTKNNIISIQKILWSLLFDK